MSHSSPLTKTSQDFLKAATCAPDNGLAPRIPDGSGERTFTQKFARFGSITCPAGKTTLIVCPPSFPQSYYTVSYTASAGGLPFTGTAPNLYAPQLESIGSEYVETKTEFPEWFDAISPSGVSNTSQVTSGRVVSLSAELECTTNAYNQYGTVSAFRTPLQFTESPGLTSGATMQANIFTITGAGSIISDSASTGAYMGAVKDGAYSVSMNRNGGSGDFEFTPLLDNTHFDEAIHAPVKATAGGRDTIPFKGAPILWDNHYDSIVFKVIVPAGTDQSFILKNWLSVEMCTSYGSFLHGIAQPSPPRDPRAFKLYGAIQQNLPTAVPSKDNPGFWSTVLGLIKPISGIASMIPGPIGAVAKGVHAVSSVLSPEISGGASSQKAKFKTASHSFVVKRRGKKKKKRRAKAPARLELIE